MLISHQQSSAQIYAEQLQNQFDKGVGYSEIRKYLLTDLNGGGEMLADVVVDVLIRNLGGVMERSEKQARAIQIIQDLLTYADEAVSASFHTKPYVQELVGFVLEPKFITFNMAVYFENKLRVCGIFLFWYEKYHRDGSYNLFIDAFNELKAKGAQFPEKSFIVPRDQFKKKTQQEEQTNAVSSKSDQPQKDSIVLEDIEQFTKQTENLLKYKSSQLYTTNYVRLIKHKSKVLYGFTTAPTTLTTAEKNTVKLLYKKLRDVLKEIEKVNVVRSQIKRNEEQKKFMQQKIEGISPKKSDKGSIKKQDNSMNLTKSQPIDLLSETPVITSAIQLQKVQSAQLNADLLDISPKSNTSVPIPGGAQLIDIQKPPQPQLFKPFSSQAHIKTPTKNDFKPDTHDDNDQFLKKSENHSNSQSKSQSFHNQKHSQNEYNYIPADLNLTGSSSSRGQTPAQLGNFFSNLWKPQKTMSNGQFAEGIGMKQAKYDEYRTPNKKRTLVDEDIKSEGQRKTEGIRKFQQIEVGIAGSQKMVKPVDYMQMQYLQMGSPGSNISADEDRKIVTTPKKQTNKNEQEDQQFTPYASSPIKLGGQNAK